MKKPLLKKKALKKIALYGIAAGLCTTQGLFAAQNGPNTSAINGSQVEEDNNSSNLGYKLMSEDELLLELNDEGYKLYMSLDPEGKKLAREVASTRCGKTNKCKGLNACATEKNKCVGQGECKNSGVCSLSDKNLAVKLVVKKLAAEKRAKALKSNNNSR